MAAGVGVGEVEGAAEGIKEEVEEEEEEEGATTITLVGAEEGTCTIWIHLECCHVPMVP